MILKNFGTVIKTSAEVAPRIGVDISGEERYHFNI